MRRDLSKLRQRLAALRNMTTANGCTEAEALAAAEKAAELLASTGMTDIELDASLMEGLPVDIGARRRPIDSVWITVAVFAECHGYLERVGNRWRWVYFGDPANILVAEYVHEVVRRAARTAAREFRAGEVYRRRRTARTKAQVLKALEEGFALGIAPKIMAGLWRRKAYRVNRRQNVRLSSSRSGRRSRASWRGAACPSARRERSRRRPASSAMPPIGTATPPAGRSTSRRRSPGRPLPGF